MKRWLHMLLLLSACNAEPQDSNSRITFEPDPPAIDVGPDLRGPPLTLPTRPTLPESITDSWWIDVHMHCRAEMCADGPCCPTTPWGELSTEGGRGMLLSLAHWKVSSTNEIGDFDVNAGYADAAAADPNFGWFASLDCWHDTPFGDGWADACKVDAIAAIEAGALGFKDHAGKQFDSNGDGGLFLGALNTFAGTCEVDDASQTPNEDCMQQSTVRYPALDAQYREVVRFIVSELRVPLVTHLTSWEGAQTRCYNPLTEAVELCAAVGRQHQQRFAKWAESIDEEDRRRIIIAHLGFLTDDDEALRALLDTGVSVDTARPAIATVGCAGRELLADFPDQFVFGTDRRPGAACNGGAYDMFLYALLGGTDETRSFEDCTGPVDAVGMDLDERVVEGCADLPAGVDYRVMKGNFIAMYD